MGEHLLIRGSILTAANKQQHKPQKNKIKLYFYNRNKEKGCCLPMHSKKLGLHVSITTHHLGVGIGSEESVMKFDHSPIL